MNPAKRAAICVGLFWGYVKCGARSAWAFRKLGRDIGL